MIARPTVMGAGLRTAAIVMIGQPIVPSAIVNSHRSPTGMTVRIGDLAASASWTAIRSCRVRMSNRER